MWFCLGRFEHWGWLDKLLGNDNGHDDDICTCLFYLFDIFEAQFVIWGLMTYFFFNFLFGAC